MEFTYRHKNESNTIKIVYFNEDIFRFIVRSEESKMVFEEMEILLSRSDIAELKKLIEGRNVGKLKVGKSKGICRQYLSVERNNVNSPIALIINKWVAIFGGCFGVELYREESEGFIHALETANF
jgi:hypothetical protein